MYFTIHPIKRTHLTSMSGDVERGGRPLIVSAAYSSEESRLRANHFENAMTFIGGSNDNCQ